MKDKVIAKIPEHYVSDDSVQVMYGYRDQMALIGEEKTVTKYVDWKNGEIINSYLTDERKKDFPYSNIPSFVESDLFGKYKNVNQILSFGHQYLLFQDDEILYDYPIKYGKSAFLVRSTPILDKKI